MTNGIDIKNKYRCAKTVFQSGRFLVDGAAEDTDEGTVSILLKCSFLYCKRYITHHLL